MRYVTPAKPLPKPADCISNLQFSAKPESNQVKFTPAETQSMTMKNTAKRKLNVKLPANF